MYPNCPVKKKIGRYQGEVTEVIYRGPHNHPKPLSNQRSALESSYSFGDMQLDNTGPSGTGVNSELALGTIQQEPTAGGLAWRNNNLEVASLAALPSEYCSGTANLHSNGSQLGSADAVDVSSTYSKNEEEYVHGTCDSVSLGYDAGGDQSESKRRKNKPSATDMSGTSKATRQGKSSLLPRAVVLCPLRQDHLLKMQSGVCRVLWFVNNLCVFPGSESDS